MATLACRLDRRLHDAREASHEVLHEGVAVHVDHDEALVEEHDDGIRFAVQAHDETLGVPVIPPNRRRHASVFVRSPLVAGRHERAARKVTEKEALHLGEVAVGTLPHLQGRCHGVRFVHGLDPNALM